MTQLQAQLPVILLAAIAVAGFVYLQNQRDQRASELASRPESMIGGGIGSIIGGVIGLAT